MDNEKDNMTAQEPRRERTRRRTGNASSVRTGSASSDRTRARKRRRRKRKPGLLARLVRALRQIKNPKRAAAITVAVIAAFFAVIFLIKGCTVSHKSPEAVTKTLVESYVNGNKRKIRKCYGVKKADEELQSEIDAKIAYYDAHAPKEVVIDDCGAIYTDGNYTYMYVTYELVLENDESYPCIDTYMAEKNSKDKYYVLTSSEITDEMSTQAASAYASFMNTDAYKNYQTAYDKFIKKNPGYEDKIKSKLS